MDRSHLRDASTVVIKAGTSCLTRDDGLVSLSRIGALIEQISTLARAGKRVIFVASGAVGLGGAKLAEQEMLSRSVRLHLQPAMSQRWGLPPSNGPSARAKAAAGQGGLMGLYDALFSQFGVTCGQILVTESDFSDERARNKLVSTLSYLLDHGVIPIVNENDVLAAPEKRSLFTDNDSLAVLVAVELQAELLLLLSDVRGVYTRAPSAEEPVPPVLPLVTRQTKLNFGAKSARGRGGMQAKVDAALAAVERGIGCVVIASGLAQDTVERVMTGEPIGTAFGSNDTNLSVGSEQNRLLTTSTSTSTSSKSTTTYSSSSSNTSSNTSSAQQIPVIPASSTPQATSSYTTQHTIPSKSSITSQPTALLVSNPLSNQDSSDSPDSPQEESVTGMQRDAVRAREAARELQSLGRGARLRALHSLARLLRSPQEQAILLAANEKDLKEYTTVNNNCQ